MYSLLVKMSPLYFIYLKILSQQNNTRIKSLIYKEQDLNVFYYKKVKELGNTELEHQIGRLINFRRTISNIDMMTGDMVEFGSWRGFSLLWIAYLLERQGIFNKKLLGIDGFTGLPYTDGIFSKYDFSDTSLKICRENIYKSDLIYPITKKNTFILKSFFKEQTNIIDFIKKEKFKKFCFIHIDCDVSQSVVEIFDLLLKYNLIADSAYILFDDYYCQSKFQKTVEKIFSEMREKWIIKKHSNTDLTQNFFIKKR